MGARWQAPPRVCPIAGAPNGTVGRARATLRGRIMSDRIADAQSTCHAAGGASLRRLAPGRRFVNVACVSAAAVLVAAATNPAPRRLVASGDTFISQNDAGNGWTIGNNHIAAA